MKKKKVKRIDYTLGIDGEVVKENVKRFFSLAQPKLDTAPCEAPTGPPERPSLDWLREGASLPRQLFRCLDPGCGFKTYCILKITDHQKATERYEGHRHKFEGVFLEAKL